MNNFLAGTFKDLPEADLPVFDQRHHKHGSYRLLRGFTAAWCRQTGYSYLYIRWNEFAQTAGHLPGNFQRLGGELVYQFLWYFKQVNFEIGIVTGDTAF